MSNGSVWRFKSLALIAFLSLAFSIQVQATSVNVYPSDNVQAVVNSYGIGTTFVFTPGVYRMQSIIPKDGDIFEGQPGAILNGSRQLNSFSRSGIYWVVGGQTQQGQTGGVCQAGYAGCEYPEDLFFNNIPLQRVETLSQVAAGKWYFDHSAAKVYFVDDPTGKTVEIGVTTHAFYGSATNVTIKGLIVEKYAMPANDGAISGRGTGWVVESNEIRLNHGAAVRMASYEKILKNNIHHNGQLGLSVIGLSSGANILVQDNIIAYNNTRGFDWTWSAGGTHLAETTNLVVQGNYVHDNRGPGIWVDFENYNWLIQGNRTANNFTAGIFDELSYDGIVRYNVVQNDASFPGHAGLWWTAGIRVHASPNAQIYGNSVINCGDGIGAVSNARGSGNRGAFLVQNLSVHDNVIVQSAGSAAGAVADSTTNGGYYLNVYSTSWNNHWQSNTYKLPNSVNLYIWKGGSGYAGMDATQWQSFGQDTAGTWISSTDSTFPSAKFSANQRVYVLGSAQVWSMPTTTSTLVTTEANGAPGTVTQVAGPIRTGGNWWWNIKYDDGQQGWSEETYLQIF